MMVSLATIGQFADPTLGLKFLNLKETSPRNELVEPTISNEIAGGWIIEDEPKLSARQSQLNASKPPKSSNNKLDGLLRGFLTFERFAVQLEGKNQAENSTLIAAAAADQAAIRRPALIKEDHFKLKMKYTSKPSPQQD